jgi:hypothetical protein
MTGWAWLFLGLSVFWMVMTSWILTAAIRLAARLNRAEELFKEQEREHIREIQELVNQYEYKPTDGQP